VLGALADTSGELLPNGDVLFTRNERIYVGELQGDDSGRSRHIADALDSSGVRAAAVANIESLEWSKYAAWVGLMALAVTTRAATCKFMIDPDLALVLAKLVREMGVLAAARQIPLSNQSPLPVATIVQGTESEAAAVIQAGGRELQIKAPGHRMSGLQDLEAGRALEVEETLGYAVCEAARLRVPLPNVSTFHALLAGIDRIRR
jgi:2-dehydropantoate 2-reductase